MTSRLAAEFLGTAVLVLGGCGSAVSSTEIPTDNGDSVVNIAPVVA